MGKMANTKDVVMKSPANSLGTTGVQRVWGLAHATREEGGSASPGAQGFRERSRDLNPGSGCELSCHLTMPSSSEASPLASSDEEEEEDKPKAANTR